ncbi:uncharacterized protein [Ptychodera flava]|uniref:uncharacterized protein n=1 Tax=Ptychodera flava TaxID=63121 RepID=UPI00396A009A
MSQVGSSHKWRGIAVVSGGILVNITQGNISPYLTSYIRKRSKPTDLTYEMATWIVVAYVSMLGSCMYFGGLFHRKIGARLTVSVSSIIYSIKPGNCHIRNTDWTWLRIGPWCNTRLLNEDILIKKKY